MNALKVFVAAIIFAILCYGLHSIEFDYSKVSKVDAVVIAKSSGMESTGKYSTGAAFILAVRHPSGYEEDLKVSLGTFSKFQVGDVAVIDSSPYKRNEDGGKLCRTVIALFVLFAIIAVVLVISALIIGASDALEYFEYR